MIDTHAHLTFPPLSDSPVQVWQRAQDAGVKTAILVGTSVETSKQHVDLLESLPGTYAAVGIHPDEARTAPDFSLIEDLARHPGVVAIGECGLDYCAIQDANVEEQQAERTRQRVLFGKHIVLAKERQLPLSIHCRNTTSPKITDTPLNAYRDILDTLKHFSTDDGVYPTFILHCMSGPLDYLEEALRMGAYISFAGNITYPSADHLRTLLEATPLDRLLLETDCPFLSPQGHRGTSNEPSFIGETYAFVANELGLTIDGLAKTIDANASACFGIFPKKTV